MFIYQITLYTNEHIWIMRRGTMPRTWLYPARNNPQNTENEQRTYRFVLVSFDLSNPRTIAIVPAYRMIPGLYTHWKETTRGRKWPVQEVIHPLPSCPRFPFLFQQTASGPHPSCPWSRLDASRVTLGPTEELGRIKVLYIQFLYIRFRELLGDYL